MTVTGTITMMLMPIRINGYAARIGAPGTGGWFAWWMGR